MSFQAFLDEIKKDLPSSVYLLHSSDPFILREALGAIKRFIPEEERDFNLAVFDFLLEADEKTSFENMLDVAHTFPFFGKRRFIVYLGNLQRLSKKDLKRLETYVLDPVPSSVFAILHEGNLKKETREKFRTVKAFSLTIGEGEIPSWIKHRARMRGIEITDDIAEYLLGSIGPDLGLLSAEIEKITLLGKQRVSVDDIHEIIGGEGFYSPFDLVEALEGKNTEKVFRVYKALKETTENYSLIGVLNWLYSRKLSMIRGQKKDKYFHRVFEILNKADIYIKTSGRDYPIEHLLIKLLRL